MNSANDGANGAAFDQGRDFAGRLPFLPGAGSADTSSGPCHRGFQEPGRSLESPTLLNENDISYLKWDQNRDLAEHGHAGRPSVHETLAAHPGVEIESCSSGGARIDLGILQRTDRV